MIESKKVAGLKYGSSPITGSKIKVQGGDNPWTSFPVSFTDCETSSGLPVTGIAHDYVLGRVAVTSASVIDIFKPIGAQWVLETTLTAIGAITAGSVSMHGGGVAVISGTSTEFWYSYTDNSSVQIANNPTVVLVSSTLLDTNPNWPREVDTSNHKWT